MKGICIRGVVVKATLITGMVLVYVQDASADEFLINGLTFRAFSYFAVGPGVVRLSVSGEDSVLLTEQEALLKLLERSDVSKVPTSKEIVRALLKGGKEVSWTLLSLLLKRHDSAQLVSHNFSRFVELYPEEISRLAEQKSFSAEAVQILSQLPIDSSTLAGRVLMLVKLTHEPKDFGTILSTHLRGEAGSDARTVMFLANLADGNLKQQLLQLADEIGRCAKLYCRQKITYSDLELVRYFEVLKQVSFIRAYNAAELSEESLFANLDNAELGPLTPRFHELLLVALDRITQVPQSQVLADAMRADSRLRRVAERKSLKRRWFGIATILVFGFTLILGVAVYLWSKRNGHVNEKRSLIQFFGLSEEATLEELKKSFRVRVKQVHPDLHFGAGDEALLELLSNYKRLMTELVRGLGK